ncbi:hypothetical protein HYV50_02685 [Candidatus Pacearchaeota archaeon]|nr:hypothetical protein [Candidatus Pacearchaeota archaeon]
MVDLNKANYTKERILSIMKYRGPVLPVQVSKEISMQPLFASAFLSELVAEGQVKISNMRVGGSPLYYLPGQESMLENFIEYLNQREKEAFLLLKNSKFLEDEAQTPVIRVALRAIKDFAFPVRARVNGDTKLFWKFFAFSDEEIVKMIDDSLAKKKEPELKEEIKKGKKKHEIQKRLRKDENGVEERIEGVEIAELKKEKKSKLLESKFTKDIKDYLIARDIEILEILSESKKAIEARVRVDSLFGKQEYYLIAKDKKSITDEELFIALQKAHAKKMPSLVMAPGELNKKAKEEIKEWNNLVKFEKLKL